MEGTIIHERQTEWLDPLSQSLVMEPPSRQYGSPYLDIRTDFGFKHTFGREANKDLTIHFLNSLLPHREPICDIRFCPTEYLGLDESTRTVIYDILCVSGDGACFLLEMQRAYQDFFERRTFHYTNRLVSEQVPAGKAGDSFKLEEVNFIGLLDFLKWEAPDLMQHPVRRYLRGVDNTWTDTREPFSNVNWRFIQLPAFNKDPSALHTDLDRWIYLINNLHLAPDLSLFERNPIFRKLIQINTINKLSKEDQHMYKLSIDVGRDWRNALSHAERTGEQRMKETKDMAFVRTLVRDTDFDDQKIAALAGVEEDFVRNIRKKTV